ncbi:hypothetical protein GCM10009585_14140 [Brevibacterium paucivorans]|uniref:DUF4190 domain-containing protein n=1 Tax=Brevibacterium paucivorans TaxID=170994 RepID=UPI0031D299C5
MSNPYGGSSYPGGGNNTPPSAPGSQPPSPSSPQAPQYGGGNYGSGNYGSSAGQSTPSAPGSPSAPSAPSSPGGPSYPGGSSTPGGPGSPGGPSYPGGPLGGSGNTSEKNGIGLWAMILGLAGIVFGLLTGLPGAIMGMIGLKNVKNGEADNKGQALTGLIAGILTSLGSLIGGVIVIILIAAGAIGAGSGKTEPTSPQTQGAEPGGEEPRGGQEPGGSGGQEPGSGSGDNSGGSAPEIDNGVNLAVRSKQVTAGSYAVPSEAQNSEYMFIEVSLKNNSSSDYRVPYPLITADLDGKNLDRVTDIDNQKKGAGDWPSSIAPGEEAIYQTGFLVTGADAKRAKVTVRLGGKKYDFKNS